MNIGNDADLTITRTPSINLEVEDRQLRNQNSRQQGNSNLNLNNLLAVIRLIAALQRRSPRPRPRTPSSTPSSTPSTRTPAVNQDIEVDPTTLQSPGFGRQSIPFRTPTALSQPIDLSQLIGLNQPTGFSQNLLFNNQIPIESIGSNQGFSFSNPIGGRFFIPLPVGGI